MALKILRERIELIRSSKWFTIMADETTDVSNKEQMVVCIRWVDENLEMFEDFIGLHEMDNTSANTIVKVIKVLTFF